MMTVYLDILLDTFRIDLLGEFLLLIILLLGSALISASEVGFFSLKPSDIKELEERKLKKGTLVLKLLEKPERLLANILIANNFINISIVILSAYVTQNIFDFSASPVIGFLVQVVIITFIILLIGEIIPKIFATENNIKTALNTAFPLSLLSKMLHPFTSFLIWSSSFAKKHIAAKKPDLSINDLSDAIEITSDSLSEEKNILEGIVKFGNTAVSEIMRPRLDIVAIEFSSPLSRILSLIVETGYSRIPVYEETLDNIKGILLTKDLLPYLYHEDQFRWQGLIKDAYYIPETKKIDDLLVEFQKKKNHLAIVIDEYGGTCGLVTLEDILEEIVGEISDESDVDEELLYKVLTKNTYLFEAKILLNDFYKVTGIDGSFFDEVKGEYETLAGLILELKGEIPLKNDKIEYKNLSFTIEAVDNRRIKQVRMTVN
jgi:putative hemolysin